MLEDLFVGPALKMFRTLQLEYSIPQVAYYRYIQIFHLLNHSKNVSIYLPWKIAQYYLTKHTKTKGTSLIYKHLQKKQEFF